jgi:hypothetical protein|tara:strand:- start:478 stop:624 length:147 start_codon:yes stop_codon:yes gene_type:complete
MLKKFASILWTYSPEDYWKALWSKTQIDEKVRAKAKKVKKAIKVLKGK